MTAPRRLVLAFDFGLKRIGIATGNLLTRTASPVTTLVWRDAPPWREIDALVAEWRPDLLVVGDPGETADASLRESLAHFVQELAARYGLPLERADESFTSATAHAGLRAGRRKGIYNRRVSKARIDSHAACLIAEQWMRGTGNE